LLVLSALLLLSCSYDNDETTTITTQCNYSQHRNYKKVIEYEYAYYSDSIISISEEIYDDIYQVIPYSNPLPPNTTDTISINRWQGGGGGHWGGLIHDITIEYNEYNQFD